MAHKSIYITGVGAGIGQATVQYFSQRGWRVGGCDANPEALAQCAEDLGLTRESFDLVDVRDAEALRNSIARFTADDGRLDLMFNNAGIVIADQFHTVPAEAYRRLVEVNLIGTVNGALAAFEALRNTPSAQMINMCSASALYGTPDYAVYSATKLAVRGLTEALSIEWQSHDIRVMDVLPLFVSTAMVTEIRAPSSIKLLGVRLTAQDVAGTVWRAAHSRRGWFPRVHWLVGVQAKLLGLSVRLLPSWMTRLTTKKVSGY